MGMAAKARLAGSRLAHQTTPFRYSTLIRIRSPFSGSFPGGWRVFKGMGNPTTPVLVDQKSLLEPLRADYDAAFRNWAAQVRLLQSVDSGDPRNRGAIDEARRWADEAAAVYREKRNLFLNHVIASRSRRAAPAKLSVSDRPVKPPVSRHDRPELADETSPVRKLARQIWEEAGRPAGTAEQDWQRAEEILQTRR